MAQRESSERVASEDAELVIDVVEEVAEGPKKE
jgi:hypothetical protein